MSGSTAHRPGHPPRIQLSRRRRMPYGCKNVTRPGTYGNPFTVAEYGDQAVPMLRELLAHPDRHPSARHPSLRQVREELAG